MGRVSYCGLCQQKKSCAGCALFPHLTWSSLAVPHQDTVLCNLCFQVYEVFHIIWKNEALYEHMEFSKEDEMLYTYTEFYYMNMEI